MEKQRGVQAHLPGAEVAADSAQCLHGGVDGPLDLDHLVGLPRRHVPRQPPVILGFHGDEPHARAAVLAHTRDCCTPLAQHAANLPPQQHHVSLPITNAWSSLLRDLGAADGKRRGQSLHQKHVGLVGACGMHFLGELQGRRALSTRGGSGRSLSGTGLGSHAS